jgi:hypothetical protein
MQSKLGDQRVERLLETTSRRRSMELPLDLEGQIGLPGLNHD